MKPLFNTFHMAFWFCVICLVLLIAGAFVSRDSALFRVAAYGLPGLLVGGLVYAVALGALATKYGKSGALWGTMAYFFGPIGLVVSYVSMSRMLKSGVPASETTLPKSDQKKLRWQLLVAFVVVIVVANIAIRLFR